MRHIFAARKSLEELKDSNIRKVSQQDKPLCLLLSARDCESGLMLLSQNASDRP